ncbi:hypothetical protein GF373_08940 [bacterium]|nr:hypothetical protein [bacterium]
MRNQKQPTREESTWIKTTERCLDRAAKRLNGVENSIFRVKMALGLLFLFLLAYIGIQLLGFPASSYIQPYLTSLGISPPEEHSPLSPQSHNCQLTTKGFEALNQNQYNDAISFSRKCIDKFHENATETQDSLKANNIPSPLTGTVAGKDPNKIKSIFDRGLLNDVAACLFIQGMAHWHLKQYSDAQSAFEQTLAFPHARVWDPGSQAFWSPTSAAQEKLDEIQQMNTSNHNLPDK